MGCLLAKLSTHSPPQGLTKMKIENGYVGGEGGRQMGQKQFSKDSGKLFRHEMITKNAAGAAVGGGAGGGGGVGGEGGKDWKLITREREKEVGGSHNGNVSQRISTVRQVGVEELVDGWPKWLTDNIPREALIGLVPRSAESYDKLDKVGQGTYSNVYKARDRDSGKIVALKKVRFDTSESESVKFMAREITIVQKLDHPNIIKLIGLATSRMQYSLYLVFDFMLSDLSRVIARPDVRLTEPQVKCYMQQLLSGLQHCHERGILHRDIKGSNLLIDKNGMLKIADFGLANEFNPNQKRPLTSRVVTLWYRAPELLLGATDYGIGIDLWSAGCLLAEMFAGRPIMPGRTEVEQLHRIFKLCGSPSEEYWKKLKLSTSFRPPQPYKPSLAEAFKDFPPSSLGLLTTLLSLDPAYRGTASTALLSELHGESTGKIIDNNKMIGVKLLIDEGKPQDRDQNESLGPCFGTWSSFQEWNRSNQFFSMSPSACDLSGLPVIYKEEDQAAQAHERRKASKMKQRSRTYRERQKKKKADEKQKGDSGSSKEELEKSAGPSSSAGSTSSSAKPSRNGGSPFRLTSPDVPPHHKRLPRTEGHPNATKNIKNLPPLLASEKSTTTWNEGNLNIYKLTLDRRSASTTDFRQIDQSNLSRH